MAFRGIGADNQKDFRMVNVSNRIPHGPITKGSQCCRHRRCMAEPCTVVHIVGAQNRSREFLDDIIVLIGALCRAEHPDGTRAVAINHPGNALRHSVQGFLPVRFAENLTDLALAHRFGNLFSSNQGVG